MNSWEKISIGDFLFERKGRYKPDDKVVSGLKRIEKIDFKGVFHIGIKSSKTGMILIKPGDLVISGINVTKGAMGIYEGKKDVTATIHYSSYTFDKNIINVAYFKRFLKSKVFLDLLKEQVKGGIKTEIKPKHLLPLEIFLPNKTVQDEIVNHFENCEDEISDLDAEITRQQTLLKKLCQSILQDAICGKLTKKWRKENPDVEPASEVLKRIKEEQERLVKEKKIKKQKPLLPITEDEIPFELPKGWIWCRLGEITNVVRGGSPRPAGDRRFYGGSIPFLKVADLTKDEAMYLDTHTYTIKESGLHKTRYVEAGTLMLTNSGATLGVPKICSFPTTFNDGIAAFIYLDEELNKEFLYYFLKMNTQWFLKEVSRGQGQPNLNTDIIGNTLLPLPPKIETKKILKRLKKALIVHRQVESQTTKSKNISGLLMQAVLKEAFEG